MYTNQKPMQHGSFQSEHNLVTDTQIKKENVDKSPTCASSQARPSSS